MVIVPTSHPRHQGVVWPVKLLAWTLLSRRADARGKAHRAGCRFLADGFSKIACGGGLGANRGPGGGVP